MPLKRAANSLLEVRDEYLLMAKAPVQMGGSYSEGAFQVSRVDDAIRDKQESSSKSSLVVRLRSSSSRIPPIAKIRLWISAPCMSDERVSAHRCAAATAQTEWRTWSECVAINM